MSHKAAKAARRQLKKFQRKNTEIGKAAIQELMNYPLHKRLWFAWRIIDRSRRLW